MAIVANLSQPALDFSSVYVVLPSLVVNRWPIPVTAWGFMNEVPDTVEIPSKRIASPYLFMGGLVPEGQYMEPTVGQIWPR